MSILTAGEAAAVLRVASDTADMLNLLPQIDEYIFNATGHEWASDVPINAAAKAAARILLVLWFENPSMVLSGGAMPLTQGLTSLLGQLEVVAGYYHNFEGLAGAGSVTLCGVCEGDVVESVVGISNATGDASSSFEGVISMDGALLQTSSSDLSEKFYRAYVVPLAAIR